MAAEGKLYTIYYTDGAYLSYHLLDKEYDILSKHLENRCVEGGLRLSIGTLMLKDIRSVILQREEVASENPSGTPELSEEEQAWLNAVEHAKRLDREKLIEEADDIDYEGGMLP
jgi:hypothetical protein